MTFGMDVLILSVSPLLAPAPLSLSLPPSFYISLAIFSEMPLDELGVEMPMHAAMEECTATEEASDQNQT